MEAGRQRALESKMTGCVNVDKKMTDIYLPRKCDFTDRVITSKDHSSVQISLCDVLVPLPRSTTTARSTWANPTWSSSAASCAPPDRATPVSKKSSRRRNSSDSLDIFHSFTYHSTKAKTSVAPLPQLRRKVTQIIAHPLLSRHHRVPELGLVVQLLVPCLLRQLQGPPEVVLPLLEVLLCTRNHPQLETPLHLRLLVPHLG